MGNKMSMKVNSMIKTNFMEKESSNLVKEYIMDFLRRDKNAAMGLLHMCLAWFLMGIIRIT